MKTRIEVALTEGQSLDAAKLNDALRAAGLTFNGFHHAQAAIVECDPADEQEVRAIIAAHLADSAKRAHNAPLDAAIAKLEASVTPRMLREAAAGIDTTRLAAIDTEIAALRAQRMK